MYDAMAILFYLILPVVIVIAWIKILYLNEIMRQKRIIVSFTEDHTDFGSVSLIIPARNEEMNIRECILSAQKSSYPFVEIIVVDDQSSDDTAKIVASLKENDSRITLLSVNELPEGWAGKNYALFTGASHAQSDWLLFIDADVRLDESAIVQSLHFARQESIDILSLSPYQICLTYYEKILQPEIFYLLNYMYPLHRINQNKSSIAALNGSFIVTRKKDYFFEKL